MPSVAGSCMPPSAFVSRVAFSLHFVPFSSHPCTNKNWQYHAIDHCIERRQCCLSASLISTIATLLHGAEGRVTSPHVGRSKFRRKTQKSYAPRSSHDDQGSVEKQKKTASTGSRTLVSCLEGKNDNRYTINAKELLLA